MKIVNVKYLVILLSLLVNTTSKAQNETVINDPNAQKRTLQGSFSALTVTDGIVLYLSQGSEESIAISANDPKYIDRFRTEVSNGVLKLYYDNKGVNWTGNEKRNLKAYVSFKMLQKINASGGANLILKSVLTAERMECTFSSGSKFTGQVDTHELDISQNSGASIEIKGRADRLRIEVSSGAIFKGYELPTDYCEAKASSGGSVRISVNKELTVKATSGGGIHYKGDGVIKDMIVSSGGSVKKG